MRIRRFHAPLVWITVIVHLSLGIGPLCDKVACRAPDGHVRVETALLGICSGSEPEAAVLRSCDISRGSAGHDGTLLSSGDASQQSADHCGACIDIPIPTVCLGRRVSTAANTCPPAGSRVLADSPEVRVPSARLATEPLHSSLGQPPLSARVSIQTVVLLI